LLQHQITAKAQRIWFKNVCKYLLSSNDLKGEREREREREREKEEDPVRAQSNRKELCSVAKIKQE
jgi:hypothetical protein